MKPVLAAAAIALATALPFSAHAQSVSVDIDSDESYGTINPNIYGQFMEHLGRGIYEGIWVGEDSDIPNTNGYRTDVVEALKELEVPLVRWPGGCYADVYHWRDGIGERANRLNSSWGNTIEPNTFGTHEFFNFAELIGAETYLNFNVATGTPAEAVAWMEYITSDSESDLANERRANGRDEPWTIDYYSIGNETWGCGGNLDADYYASLYAQFETFLAASSGEQPERIISGSHDGNIGYTRTILEKEFVRLNAEGVSVHFYTLPTGDWGDKGEGTGFDEDQWFSTLNQTLRMKGIIEEQIAMLDEMSAPNNQLDLYVDEWGVWTNTPEGATALYQQNTIREAVVAALNFNIFHEHADRVPMSNIAQMVNVLQAMILTDGADMILTPTYHAYHLYRPFQGAEALTVSYDSPDYSHGDGSIPQLSVSAARTEEGEMVLALVNTHSEETLTVSPMIDGEAIAAASGQVLTADALDAHNTFEAPETVTPQDVSFEGDGGISVELPPKSVMVLTIE